MYKGKSIICTICARGGSKGVHKKNTRLLNGKPLLVYTIEQAQELSWVDRIVLSTDDPEIKNVGEKCGLEVPFFRPKALAQDSSPKIPAIIHAVTRTERLLKESYDIIIDLDPSSPLRTTQDVTQMVDMLTEEPRTDVILSVVRAHKNPYFNMFEINTQGYAVLSKKPKARIERRQDAPQVYDANASIYVMWKKIFLKNQSIVTPRTRVYCMSDESSIDIDRPIDFDFVEFIMKRGTRK